MRQGDGLRLFCHRERRQFDSQSECNDREKQPSRLTLSKTDLVRLALRYWAIQAVFFKAQWKVEKGAEAISMFPLEVPGFWFGHTLLPRLVNQQLDRIFERRMNSLEKEILAAFKEIVKEGTHECWCATFLVCFILLHSLERDTWSMRAWEVESRRDGGVKWPLGQTGPSRFCEQNQYLAHTVAKYFFTVGRGFVLLGLDWSKESNKKLLSPHERVNQWVCDLQRVIKSGGMCSALNLQR